MGKARSAEEVRLARRGSSIKAIRQKAEAGTTHGDERAFIRVGTAVTQVLTGQDDLSEWDDEELRRGYRRDKRGQWRGKPPVVVPKQIHDELTRRLMAKANTELRDNLVEAVQCLTEIVKDGDVEPKDRLRAVGMVLDRVMGKTPDKVEFTGDAPWMVALNAGIIAVTPIKQEEDGDGDEADAT